MKKDIKVTKYGRVANTDSEMAEAGIIAFELVKFEINFYGNVIESILDTKILSDGRQVVIEGCGYIKTGFELA